MKHLIDNNLKKPFYLQLYELLKKDITDKIYNYGDKLPSKRTLGADTGLSVITVEHSYDILCSEGYVESRQRSGYYVIYKESDFLFSGNSSDSGWSFRHKKRVNGSKSDKSGDFPFSVMAKTMRRVILDYENELFVKSDNIGCLQLRNAICSYLARSNGMRISPEQVVIGAGAEYLYGVVVQLLGTKRIYATEDPCYEKILMVYSAHGVEIERLPLGEDGIATEALESSFASVLHITPFHSYPSGITATAGKRMEYLSFASERDGFIIEDNYDSELTVSKKNEDTVYSLSNDERVIYINTFSMTISPSFRVGYMIVPPKLVEEYERRLGFYSCTVPVFEQLVLAELLDNGDFERHINRIRRAKRKNASVKNEF